jgi:hypothetical protein
MATLLMEAPAMLETTGNRWLVFRYLPVSLFSLKMSRATSTAGKTLLIPTYYAAKMAFLDSALRHGLVRDAKDLVRGLARAQMRIGVPEHACVTGTIQSVRQEVSDTDRKGDPKLPFYRASIAMREFVHYQGAIRLAFDLESCGESLPALLRMIAPAIHYLGKRGSFLQYLDCSEQRELDATFTEPAHSGGWGQRATLDDFGAGATFDALNSFSPAAIRRNVHRKFVDTTVPLKIRNFGAGFAHYCSPEAAIESD